MNHMSRIVHNYDSSGRMESVTVPADIWNQISPLVHSIAPASGQLEKREPLEDFATFLSVWDFSYAYDPSVCCPQCQAASPDWREDPARPFALANANIGGLLVFHCKRCGATIRHKYFKDHLAVESTPGS